MFFIDSFKIEGSSSYMRVQTSFRNDDTNQFASNTNFTYVATSFSSSLTYDLRRVEVYLAKTGSPASVIGQHIYSSGANGLPSTILYTSTTKLSASAVTTISPTTSSYYFDYSDGTNLVSGSVYHICLYVANNVTGSFPAAALLVGIAYNDTPTHKLTRAPDGSAFTLIYANTQIGHSLYVLE